jgi:hypothetical protein
MLDGKLNGVLGFNNVYQFILSSNLREDITGWDMLLPVIRLFPHQNSRR